MSVADFYNAADQLLNPNLVGDRADRLAVIYRSGEHSYGEVNQQVNRFANLLHNLGIQQEQRILLALNDNLDFITCFLGAIRAGAVPVPVNTLLTEDDFAYLLSDSRARLLVVSEALEGTLRQAAENQSFLKYFLVSTRQQNRSDALADAISGLSDRFQTAPTRKDDAAFWLYTSGTTGKPKGAIHLQTHLLATAECYAREILNITENDRVFSAAKLFFAYGLGNALTFPFSVGATSVLLEEKATDESVQRTLDRFRPTLFFGVPTLYAMMLNHKRFPIAGKNSLMLCISAGEALPETLLTRWRDATGLEILDGIGSTEMLHIFISNRSGEIAPGTSGKPVQGYAARILDEKGSPVAGGEMGDLYIRGPSAATGYWNLRDRTRDSFQGHWMKTGDKYLQTPQGDYQNAGRSDDLLKVGGIYVSPMEVENALLRHPCVAEAAVVGAPDRDNLTKPKAFVVLSDPSLRQNEKDLERTLIEHVRHTLADYKRPRWVVFLDELPKTATGKIQRFRLRETDTASASQASIE